MSLETEHRRHHTEPTPHPDEPQPIKWDTSAEVEEFEHMEHAAGDLTKVRLVDWWYRTKGWATPISGDKTTIGRKFR